MALELNLFKKKGKAPVVDKKGEAATLKVVAPLTPIAHRPNMDIEVDKGVVKIGKARYAAKLIWSERNADSPKAKLESMNSGDVTARNLYVTDDRSIGFASTDLSHKKKMLPLALALDREITGDNVFGAFRLGEENDDKAQWWVVTIINGIVRQDVLVSSEDGAKGFLVSQSQRSLKARIIAPDEWGLETSVSGEIQDVLRLNPKAVPKLRRFGAVRNNLGMIVLLSFLTIVFGGGYLVWSYMAERQAELERMERERRERQVQVNDEDYPWFGTVKLTDFISSCKEAFGSLMVPVPGWQMEPLGCSMSASVVPSGGLARPVTASASWVRSSEGRIGWLRQSFPEGFGDRISMASNGQSASMSLTLKPIYDAAYFREKPLQSSEISRKVVERFQDLGIPATFSENVQTVRGGEEVPVFNNHAFSVVSSYDPSEWANLLQDVPGIVPLSLTWNPGTGEWGFNGNIYHPAILPIGAVGSY